jgi:hypothetical protein
VRVLDARTCTARSQRCSCWQRFSACTRSYHAGGGSAACGCPLAVTPACCCMSCMCVFSAAALLLLTSVEARYAEARHAAPCEPRVTPQQALNVPGCRGGVRVALRRAQRDCATPRARSFRGCVARAAAMSRLTLGVRISAAAQLRHVLCRPRAAPARAPPQPKRGFADSACRGSACACTRQRCRRAERLTRRVPRPSLMWARRA